MRDLFLRRRVQDRSRFWLQALIVGGCLQEYSLSAWLFPAGVDATVSLVVFRLALTARGPNESETRLNRQHSCSSWS